MVSQPCLGLVCQLVAGTSKQAPLNVGASWKSEQRLRLCMSSETHVAHISLDASRMPTLEPVMEDQLVLRRPGLHTIRTFCAARHGQGALTNSSCLKKDYLFWSSPVSLEP